MCGIAGFIGEDRRSQDEHRAIAMAMATTLTHRGPDDAGVWCDPEPGVAMAHRRLSIVDLSPAGHQPMVSADERWVITYNGEVYNAAELRRDLSGVTWRGHSDTEVILEGCAAWGVTATVQRLLGMFAFAVWDRHERKLWLVRDRLGIKPLYWGQFGGTFLFGSELRALKAHPAFVGNIDRGALTAFMRRCYVPAPQSIYAGIRKLEPGTILLLPWQGQPRLEGYWDLRQIARRGMAAPLDLPDADAVERLEGLLADAVQRRMIADVPLGAFLSGGVDSSTVVALMQKASSRPVKTFTIGFREDGYDEARHAKAVAGHLGTDHTELYLDARQALEAIPHLPHWYDEPFADASQIPTLLVSQLTRRHVTVALSGDGGDELFAGYNRHVLAASLPGRLGRWPSWGRHTVAAAIRALPPAAWTALSTLLPARWTPPQLADKMAKLADILPLEADALYLRLISQWPQPADVVCEGHETCDVISDPTLAEDVAELAERMQLLDSLTYLPDDILTKVDRASMAVSLEARVPLLDHRVVEFAWQLPRRLRIRNGQGKWLLRQVLYCHVPPQLVERPKMGFAVPLDDWLRGPLRDWAEDLLDAGRLTREGYFAPGPIRQAWREHLSGRRNWQYRLWNVLMFQAWLAQERQEAVHPLSTSPA